MGGVADGWSWPEVGDEDDRWGLGSHLSGREREGVGRGRRSGLARRKSKLGRRPKQEGGREEEGDQAREGGGGEPGPSPKGRKGKLYLFSFYLID